MKKSIHCYLLLLSMLGTSTVTVAMHRSRAVQSAPQPEAVSFNTPCAQCKTLAPHGQCNHETLYRCQRCQEKAHQEMTAAQAEFRRICTFCGCGIYDDEPVAAIAARPTCLACKNRYDAGKQACEEKGEFCQLCYRVLRETSGQMASAAFLDALYDGSLHRLYTRKKSAQLREDGSQTNLLPTPSQSVVRDRRERMIGDTVPCQEMAATQDYLPTLPWTWRGSAQPHHNPVPPYAAATHGNVPALHAWEPLPCYHYPRPTAPTPAAAVTLPLIPLAAPSTPVPDAAIEAPAIHHQRHVPPALQATAPAVQGPRPVRISGCRPFLPATPATEPRALREAVGAEQDNTKRALQTSEERRARLRMKIAGLRHELANAMREQEHVANLEQRLRSVEEELAQAEASNQGARERSIINAAARARMENQLLLMQEQLIQARETEALADRLNRQVAEAQQALEREEMAGQAAQARLAEAEEQLRIAQNDREQLARLQASLLEAQERIRRVERARIAAEVARLEEGGLECPICSEEYDRGEHRRGWLSCCTNDDGLRCQHVCHTCYPPLERCPFCRQDPPGNLAPRPC